MRDQDRFNLVITMKDGELEGWNDSEESAYTWGVGQAGDLMIFKTTYHAAFSAELSKDKRVFCYAPGSWLNIAVYPQENFDVETPDKATLVKSNSKYNH